MTGYQEIMTDPSYAGQIVTFTFPHIGNVGVNPEDDETGDPFAAGMVVKWDPTEPSNWRSAEDLKGWLARRGRIAIGGVDTRRLTRAIRQQGAPHVALAHDPEGNFDIEALVAAARGFAGLEGMDLAKEVTCAQSYRWDEMRWAWPDGYKRQEAPAHKVVAVDYGAKRKHSALPRLGWMRCHRIASDSDRSRSAGPSARRRFPVERSRRPRPQLVPMLCR